MADDLHPAIFKTYGLAELRVISTLTRQEADDWVKRGIISASRAPGSGRHRVYTFWNLVEAMIAKSMSKHLRAASIELIVTQIRIELADQLLDLAGIVSDPPLLILRFNADGKLWLRGPRSNWVALGPENAGVLRVAQHPTAIATIEISLRNAIQETLFAVSSRRL
jgi:hypothetical protein